MRGIALEGGGAKGAFHVGAMKALKELGVEYHAVAGASIGALNGALLATNQLEKLEKIWLSTEMSDIIKGDSEALMALMNFEFPSDSTKIKKFLSETFKQGGLDVSPLKQSLKRFVDEDEVRASNIAYGLVSVSLTDLKPVEKFIEDIPVGKLHDYMIASANLPAFKDEKLDNKRMLDGAFYDNLPINMLLDRGCDEVIAIRVFGIGRIRKISKKDRDKVIYIEPSEDLGKVLEIDIEKAKYNMRLGYFDTLRVFKALKGSRYYIDELVTEEVVLEKLLKIPKVVLHQIATFLGSDRGTYRMLFEEILPLMSELLKVDKTKGYAYVILSYYEFLAEQAKINRFEIMTFDQLTQKVNAHYSSELKSYKGIQDEIAKMLIAALPSKGVIFFPQKFKNELLIHFYYLVLQGLRDTGISL
ncbi:patatin-like phospholipase family protein [Fusibacter bizertensis]|uniref:Patatin-like phospholipase family protein n=1 Tax=Fusibacter bizertensis TaxID=1488331 RepID=A0ABT6NDS8_9FIRM|nr:patatin-like phospholipase family protein [Fusibacter bizertensis]MDH8678569.1 patatin-like phospholipase family protein [Fusibacter bizertensis]